MEKNNEMTQQEIFVKTLKVLVLANERKEILCDEELDDYFKSLVVLFGRACIMQQLSSNIYKEMCEELDELKRLEEEISKLENAEDSSLYDKQLISKNKALIENITKKYNILSSSDNVEFYEKVADKILIEKLELTTCTSSSIAEKMELLVTYDLNKLFRRSNTGDYKTRLLELSEFKKVHDLLLEKKVVEEFKKDLYVFFGREEMQFLKFCYSNHKSIAFKRFYDILLTNIKRAIKYLRVIYDQNDMVDKEFCIDDITEIYNDYRINDYPYAEEFIKGYEYVVYINSLLNKMDYMKKDDKFEKIFNTIEKKNKNLFNYFQSKFMNELNNKPISETFPINENDYSFLSNTYAEKKNNVVASFDNINNRITLNATKYEQSYIHELIKHVSSEISSSYQFIKNLDMNVYIDSVRRKISDVYRLEAYKEFVYPNQRNTVDNIHFYPKKYRKLLLNEDFYDVFMHRNDFYQYGEFMLDTNYIFNFLIDEDSIYTKLDLFLFLKNVIGLYLNENEWTLTNDESSILSSDTINSFFSKFTETFNKEGDIYEIIKSYSDELIEKGHIDGLEVTNYSDAMDVVENYSSIKSSYFNEILERIKINRKIKSK